MPKHSGSFVLVALLVCIIVYYGLKFRLLLKHLFRLAPGYWRVKRFTQNLGLSLATTVFNLQLVIADYSSSLSILLSLTKTVIVGVTFVILLSLVFVFLDYVLKSYCSHLPILAFSGSSFSKQLIAAVKEHVILLLQSESDYSSFFATIAGAVATLLGLYIGAIGVVASTSYSNVSGALRELLLRDRVSNAFIRVILLTFGISVIFMLLSGGPCKPGLLAALALAVLVIVLIAIGSQITTRTFFFFEPSTLVEQLEAELMIWMPHVALPRRFAEVASFQLQIREKCSRLLRVYDDLATVCLVRYVGSDEVPSAISSNLLRLYCRYSLVKQTIPTKSKWFALAKRHQSWFIADTARVSTALAQGSYPLMPEEEADLYWVEKRLAALMGKLIVPDFENNRLDNLSKPLVLLGDLMLSLGESLLQEEAMLLRRVLFDKYLELIPSSKPSDMIDPRQRLFVATVEILAKAPSDLAAGINRFLSSLSSSGFERAILNYLRSSPETPSGALPRDVLDTVFNFKENLQFERESEGQEITPSWFVVSRGGVALANCIVEAIVALVTYCESDAILLVNSLVAKNQGLCAVQAIEGGLQVCIKVEACLMEAEHALSRLNSVYRTPDWNWPQLDSSKCLERLRVSRKSLLFLYAERCCDLMLVSERDWSYPDYFGHGYCLAVDECFAAIRSGDIETIEHLFRHVAAMALSAGMWIETQTSLSDQSGMAQVHFEIISDIVALSGMAICYSELNENTSVWKVVMDCWEHILNGHPNSAALVRMLLIAANDRASGIIMAFRARAQSRLRWDMQLQADFQNRGLTVGFLDFTSDESPLAIRSKNCVIECLVKSSGITPNIGVLFGAQYLLQRKEATASLLTDVNLSEVGHLRSLIERCAQRKESELKTALKRRLLINMLQRIRLIERLLCKERSLSVKNSKKEFKLRRLKVMVKNLLREYSNE